MAVIGHAEARDGKTIYNHVLSAVVALYVCLLLRCLWDGSAVVVARDDGLVSMYKLLDFDRFEFDQTLLKTTLPARALTVSHDNAFVYVVY